MDADDVRMMRIRQRRTTRAFEHSRPPPEKLYFFMMQASRTLEHPPRGGGNGRVHAVEPHHPCISVIRVSATP